MDFLSTAGGAGDALGRQTHADWTAAAGRAGVDLTGFDPSAPFADRVAWALRAGLVIACVYSRFSSKLQQSTADQVRANVEYAAAHGMYVPPELICVDEAVKGRKAKRPGLTRMKAILKARLATVLLVFKVSRLFRRPYLGFNLIQEEVVEEGLRAVSVSQGIDTVSKAWKPLIQTFGMADDALLDAIADFVREGHIGLFKKGHVVGAAPVGLKRVEVPDGRPTKRGLPRTRLAVDDPVAALIRRHAAWLLEGMPVWEGVRRWRAAGGPADPRSKTRRMSPQAYVRLMTHPRLTGRLEYGRKRNAFSSAKDYTRQLVQPDQAVVPLHLEELRILPDEVSASLRALFAERKTGPRVRKAAGPRALWDLVTGVFVCGACGHRLYQAGANGQAMRCPEPDCPARVMVNRKAAVRAVCAKQVELLAADADLVDGLVASAVRQDAECPDDRDRRVAELKHRIQVQTNRIADLMEVAGTGSEADRADTMRRIKAEMAGRAGLQLELTRLTSVEARPPITPGAVRARLAEFGAVLEEAAAGRLGEDAVYKAADVFARLAGGRVVVEADPRAGRARCVVRGRFVPHLLEAAADAFGAALPPAAAPAPEVTVWLREPPRLDAIAPEVRRLYEDEGLGFRAIAKKLEIGCGNVYASYLRFYELQGVPVPPRRPRGRHKRSD